MLVVVLAAHLVPVWAFSFFPSQDGPAHVENAVLLKERVLESSSPIARQYYELNHYPEPNYLGHVLLMLLTMAVPPAAALKALVSIYMISLPLGVAYAAEGIRRGGGILAAFLTLPFLYALPLQKGNFNFCLSLTVFFMVIGFWIRRRGHLGISGTCGLTALVLLLYFSHVLSLIIGGMVLLGLAIALEIADQRLNRIRNDRAEFNWWAALAGPAIAFIPAIILTAGFFLRRGADTGESLPKLGLVVQLLRLDTLVSSTRTEALLAMGTAALFWGMLIYLLARRFRGGGISGVDGLLALASLAVLVYLITPNSASGGGQISYRLSLFPYFILILWIAAQPIPWIPKDLALIVSSALGLAFAGVNYSTVRLISGYIEEFTSVASHIERESTLLVVSASVRDYRPNGSLLTRKIRPFVHAAGYIAAELRVINLSNYEAAQGYFPLRFRSDVDPGTFLDAGDRDILDYPRVTNGKAKVDYVLVWQTGRPDEDQRRWKTLWPQMNVGFDRIYVSPNGYASLYRRKDAG